MALERWSSEPPACAVLAVYAGSRGRFREFMGTWLAARGNLNTLAAEVSLAVLPWVSHEPPVEWACAVSARWVPEYSFIGQWLLEPEWRLFYQPVPVAEEGVGPVVDRPEHPPTGVFHEWGYSQGAPVGPISGLSVVLGDGTAVGIPLLGAFASLGDVDPDITAALDSTIATLRTKPAVGDAPSGPPQALPVRMVSRLEHQEHDNPAFEMDRLEQARNEIEEDLYRLRLCCEARPARVSLYAYRDTPSRERQSVWDLRDWYARNPDEATNALVYACVDVEGVGRLHLVKPADANRTPPYRLPTPTYLLVADEDWQRRGKWVFVPSDSRLWPPPPHGNSHVERVLQHCLWEGLPEDSALVMLRLRGPDGKENQIRFGVRNEDFGPFSDFKTVLNYAAALIRAEASRAAIPTRALEDLLDTVRAEVCNVLRARGNAMGKALDDIWGTERANLDDYRLRVEHALDLVSQTVRLHEEVKQFSSNEFAAWVRLRDEVLSLDRQVIPPGSDGLPDAMARLDNLRHRIAESWRSEDQSAVLRSAAQGLRELARQFEGTGQGQ